MKTAMKKMMGCVAVMLATATMTSCDAMWDATDDISPDYTVSVGTGGWNVNVGSAWSPGVYPWGWRPGWGTAWQPVVTSPAWGLQPTAPGTVVRPPVTVRPPQPVAPGRPVTPQRPGLPGWNGPTHFGGPTTGERPGAQ